MIRRPLAVLAAVLSLAFGCTEPPMTPPPPFPTVTPPPAVSSTSSTPGVATAPANIDVRPTLDAAKSFEPPAPEVLKLANGVTVWLLERQAVPLVAVSLALPVGSANDPKGREGLAFITADMLDEGAGSRSAVELSSALQDLGTALRIGAAGDGTTISMTVLKKNFGAAFSILSDVVARPRFDPSEWKRVSDLWKNGLLKRADDPVAVARLVGQIAVYGPAHPYGHPADGLVSSAKDIDLAAVKDFYRAHYRPDKAVLCVVGAVTRAEITSAVSDALGAWKGAPAPVAAAAGPLAPWTRPKLVLVDRPGAPQSVIGVVREGVKLADPEAPLYDLVNTALGGSFTSRLNQNLREDHGYTYGAGSTFTEARQGGAFTARAAVETKVTGPALKEMLGELRKMAADGLTTDELGKVRAQDRADLVQGYETVASIAGRYASLANLGLLPDHDARASRARQSATLATLHKLARAVTPDDATIVVVGPHKELSEALAPWGDPELWDTEGRRLTK